MTSRMSFNKSKKIVVFSIFLVCFIAQGLQNIRAQSKWNRSKLTYWHAESTTFEQQDSVKVFQHIGNVLLQTDTQELRCDRAIYYDEQGLTIFKGNVFYRDSSRTMTADYFEDYAEPERQFAKGNVKLIIDQKEIFADEINYEVFNEMVYAAKNVRFVDLENNIILTSEKFTYNIKSKKALVEINPKLVRQDSLGNPVTTIQSRIFTYYDSTKVAIAEDSVIITHNNIEARSNLAEFYQKEDRILMKENPHIIQDNNEMKAKQIEMFFQNDSLKQIYLNGK